MPTKSSGKPAKARGSGAKKVQANKRMDQLPLAQKKRKHAVTKTKDKKARTSFTTIHRSFTANLKGLKTFLEHLSPVVRRHDEVLREKTQRVLTKALKIAGISKRDLLQRKVKKSKIKLRRGEAKRFMDVLESLPSLPPPIVEILYKSSFVMLVSYFDFLISDLVDYYYTLFPESLSGKDRSITLAELSICRDIPEARDLIVRKEVESVLYGSLFDQKKYFATTLKVDCKDQIVDWDKINEAVERRNIIVHNDSVVNRRYLKNVKPQALPSDNRNLEEGERLRVGEDYFTSVFEEIGIAGAVLIQCCWRKWRKQAVKEADECLVRSIYESLSEERWHVAERLGLFSRECEVSDKCHRLYLDINYYQSLKWQDKKSQLEEELASFDVTGLSPKYQLAACALKSDKDGFYRNLRQAVTVDSLTKGDLMEWPLFREFRQDPNYERKIRRVLRSVSRPG
jgi:hypothetical protein